MAIEGLAELNKLLDEYSAEVKEAEKKARNKAAKDTAAQLKNTSAKSSGGGEYASGWKSKDSGKETVVYNAKKPQLTHLLENGHVIRNKYGEYGRTNGDGKIAEAEQFGADKYVLEIERLLD